MNTARIIALGFGVIFIITGVFELKLFLGSSAAPTSYSVQALEHGAQVSNLYAVLDSYYAFYPGIVYSYKTRNRELPPTGDEIVESILYPIISTGTVTNGGVVPSFRIVVQEKVGLLRVRDLPTGVVHKASRSGMFLDELHSMRSDERRLLQSGFPDTDFRHILLFEDGRQPSSIPALVGFFGGGLTLVLLPSIFWVRQFRRRTIQNEMPGTSVPANTLGLKEGAPDKN